MKLRQRTCFLPVLQRLKQLPLPLYALLCLLCVAVIFYVSYGLSNTVAANRADVPEIYFAWERQVPFLAWSIIPYWSLNVFYALAFFLCQSRQALHHYIKQLLVAQAIAVICFLFFPLQFSWDKPLTDGLSGYLFASLANFDQPYNQAPSLHIILVLVVGQFYWYRLPRFLRPISILYFALIAVSVLTTYQHHFIDIPSGMLVGAFVLWLFPPPAKDALQAAKQSTPQQRWLNYPAWSLFYVVLAIAAIGLAVYLGKIIAVGYVFFWLAISCLLVSAAYAKLGVSVFQKQSHGQLSFAATWLLLPYLLGVRLNIAYWLHGKTKMHRITPKLYVGSIIQTKSFTAIIDTCAEYPIHHGCRLPVSGYYQGVPLLDMVSPDEQSLKIAAAAIEGALHLGHHRVYVCCALGYGRSVAVVLTWLLRYGDVKHIDDAIAIVRQAHPNMVLSKATQQAVLAAVRI